jgi:hypothetical protein
LSLSVVPAPARRGHESGAEGEVSEEIPGLSDAPYIVWEDLGDNGWSPTAFATKDQLESWLSDTEDGQVFVVTGKPLKHTVNRTVDVYVEYGK